MAETESAFIRPARRDDASALAVLIDMAGEGLASHVWKGLAESDDMPEKTVFAVGRARARREEGAFSYKNAWVMDVAEGAHRDVGGMALGYRLDDPYDLPDMASMPEHFRPLIELEAAAPGSWYLNVLAVFQDHQRQGHATRLMNHVEDVARGLGCGEASLIWSEENAGPGQFYRQLGYEERARRPLVPIEGSPHGGDWVLLVKAL